MEQVAMIVTSKTQPGKRQQVMDLYRELLAPRAEENDAQQVVVLVADQDDADTFHLFELYADVAAMGENAQAEWFAEYMAKVMPLMAGQPTVRMGGPVWTTGL